MIEPGSECAQTGLDVAKTFAECQLRKAHTQELIETRKSSNAMIASISLDDLVEAA